MDNHTVCILVYTHDEYSFMWNIMTSLLKKYAPDIKIHWLTNDSTPQELIDTYIPDTWTLHKYDSNLIWTKRFIECLNNIDSEYILFLHEDWLPIGPVIPKRLEEVTNFMYKEKCGFLLSYSHYTRTDIQDGIPTLDPEYRFYKEDNHIFQPAIWNKLVFQDFCISLNKTKHQNEDGECLHFMDLKNCWSIQNTSTVRSLRTTNAYFFPHMHALSQGLWNFTKYPTLENLLQSYGVDTKTRGIHPWWELDTQ